MSKQMAKKLIMLMKELIIGEIDNFEFSDYIESILTNETQRFRITSKDEKYSFHMKIQEGLIYSFEVFNKINGQIIIKKKFKNFYVPDDLETISVSKYLYPEGILIES